MSIFDPSDPQNDLLAQAMAFQEKLASADPPSSSETARFVKDLSKMFVDFKAHEEELQLQNEELRLVEVELRARHEELASALATVETERSRYQELFEFAPDAYLVTSRSGRIREANRATTGLLGWELNGLVGARLGVFVAEEHREPFNDQLERAVKALTSIHFESAVETHAGERLPVLFTASPSRSPSGDVIGLRWTLRAKRS